MQCILSLQFSWCRRLCKLNFDHCECKERWEKKNDRQHTWEILNSAFQHFPPTINFEFCFLFCSSFCNANERDENASHFHLFITCTRAPTYQHQQRCGCACLAFWRRRKFRWFWANPLAKAPLFVQLKWKWKRTKRTWTKKIVKFYLLASRTIRNEFQFVIIFICIRLV